MQTTCRRDADVIGMHTRCRRDRDADEIGMQTCSERVRMTAATLWDGVNCIVLVVGMWGKGVGEDAWNAWRMCCGVCNAVTSGALDGPARLPVSDTIRV